jgi:predicted double-glycine peptidase
MFKKAISKGFDFIKKIQEDDLVVSDWALGNAIM